MHTDENRNISDAKHALDLLVKEAGACEDREQLEKVAASILGAELGDRYGVAQRVCDAFNSNKALYKLSSKDVNVRENDFAILDSNHVINLMKKSTSGNAVKKLANLQPKFYANTPENPPKHEMKKTASAFNPADCIDLGTSSNVPLNIVNTLNHVEDTLQKLAHAIDRYEDNATRAMDKVERESVHMSKEAKAETYSIGSAYYGALFAPFEQTFETDAPLRKFASAPVILNTKIFGMVDDAVLANYELNNSKALLKQAAADFVGVIKKLAGAYNLYRLRKKAGVGGTIIGTALGNTIKTGLPEALGLDTTVEGEKAKLLNANVANMLKELETRRNFYEVYDDPFISTFPLEQVQSAYNTAIQKLPENLKAHPSSATQLIRSWVTKQLSHGGITSAEDAADVLEAANKLRYETRNTGNPFMIDEDED